MVVFVEPLGKPYSHLVVVKPLLFAEAKKKNDEKILFVSSIDYFESIPESFRENVIHQAINLSNSSIKNIFKIVQIILSVLYKNRNESSLKIYLLMSKAYSNFILKIISLILGKKRRIYVFIHGELQNVKLKGSFSLVLDGLLQKILYWFDTRVKTNMRFVLISNYVYENLESILGYKPKNVIGIDLPYFYDYNALNDFSSESKLILSTVGVNTPTKNSHFLNDIALKFEKEIKLGSIEFCTSSRSDGVIFNDLINNPVSKKYLFSTEEYASFMRRCNVLIFFNDDSYNLISSASYFDAINFKKPIVAIRNGQWEYNFKKYGDIGVLCKDLDELFETINNILLDKTILNKYNVALEKAHLETNIFNLYSDLLSKLN